MISPTFKRGFVTIILVLTIDYSECQNFRACGTKPSSCPDTKYRSYDGSCNNLQHPEWGIPNSTYYRLLPSTYGDGFRTPTLAKDGSELPFAREVSFTVYPDVTIVDVALTLTTMQYGQVVAHDMSMTALNNQTISDADKCCSNNGMLRVFPTNPNYCYPIVIPNNDPVYKKAGIECIQFDRTGTDYDFGCGSKSKPVEQLSAVNHYLDLSLVYGQNENTNKEIRLFKGGKLIFEQRIGQDWLPRNKNVSQVCTVVSSNEPCYMAGDVRVNQNPQLTVLQTIFLREHNRIAEYLAKLNPKWNDEKIFQEARKILIGQHQKIVYYDLLPYYLGRENMLKRRLIYENHGFVNDYNATVNPSVMNEHATAAYRFSHSLIAGDLDLVNENRNVEDEVKISESFNRPRILEDGKSNFDELTIGLSTQNMYEPDVYHDKEITNKWSKKPGKKLGLDLKAICVQRNRDHGLASYNDFREYCGLPRAKSFKDFQDVISHKNVQKLKKLYKSPDDVDATVGGSLENVVHNTLAGPTFLCIITEQFYRTRVGDRFFFENSGEIGFTIPQLQELRKASISKMICDNTDIERIQPDGFAKISPKNPLQPCKNLPSIDLSLWKQ